MDAHTEARTDDQLLSRRDAESFEEFSLRHVSPVLGYFARRTLDPELAADLTSETLAAALTGRRRLGVPTRSRSCRRLAATA